MADRSMNNEERAAHEWRQKWDTPLFTANEVRTLLYDLLHEKDDVMALLAGAEALLPRDEQGEVQDCTLQRLVHMAEETTGSHRAFLWAIDKLKSATGSDVRSIR